MGRKGRITGPEIRMCRRGCWETENIVRKENSDLGFVNILCNYQIVLALSRILS